MPGGLVVVVDKADLPVVTQYRWRPYAVKGSIEDAQTIYARTGTGKNRITMHRLLTGYKLTDHKDGDGLNNRRSNLRCATAKQNCANSRKTRRKTSSRFKGVCLQRTTGKWLAHAKGKHLGVFTDETEAAKAYNKAAKKLWGKFAKLNDV